MTEEKKDTEKNWLKKLKDFYDSYKIIIWIVSFFSGTAIYDRFVNMWNVPARLEEYRAEFIEMRRQDSIMFIKHVNVSDSVSKCLKSDIMCLRDSIKNSKKIASIHSLPKFKIK